MITGFLMGTWTLTLILSGVDGRFTAAESAGLLAALVLIALRQARETSRG